MDIQRGDQVYYRGEVWTVTNVWKLPSFPPTLSLYRGPGTNEDNWTTVSASQVQRVEQVR